MSVIEAIEKEQLKDKVAKFNVGDSVSVHTRVVEGNKERIQVFKGIIISRKGSGINESFTVRRVSQGEGVERVFPLNSPRIEKVVVDVPGKARRAKLYYLRDVKGNQAIKDLAAKAKKSAEASGKGKPEKKKRTAKKKASKAKKKAE